MIIEYSNDFISTHARNTNSKTPILFFHAWANGVVEQQGYIFRLTNEGTGSAQLFEWLNGSESGDMSFTKAYLVRCTFYDNSDEMEAAYRDHCRKAA